MLILLMENLFRIIERSTRRGWRLLLEQKRRLLGLFSRAQLCVFGRLSKQHSIAAVSIVREIHRLYVNNGRKGVFVGQYLKVVSNTLMWWYAGDVEGYGYPPQQVAVSLTRTGLPRIIPPFYRKKLRERNCPLLVKYLLSLFTLYRLIIERPKGPLVRPDTIQIKDYKASAFVEELSQKISGYVPDLVMGYTDGVSQDVPLESGFCFTPIWSSGPNTCMKPGKDMHLTSADLGTPRLSIWHTLPVDAMALAISKAPAELLLLGGVWFKQRVFNPINGWFSCLEYDAEAAKCFTNLLERLLACAEKTYFSKLRIKPANGRFGVKLEGAGKRRVFAIPNPLLQTLMRPLHNWSMRILKSIRMDGTYDQLKPIRRLRGRMELFSFDLKAATDSMPSLLSYGVLRGLLGPWAAKSWLDVMCATRFRVHMRDTFVRRKAREFVFNRGQPLGFYSSWPIFTLTHHILVWIAAAEIDETRRYGSYAILGDDIVIANPRVATAYRELIEKCGMTLSPGKSFISKTGACEFAKRFLTEGGEVDLSPFSLKVLNMFGGFTPAIFYSAFKLPYQVTMRLRGAGYRTYSNLGVPKGSRKWLRHWLLMYSKSGLVPLPIPLWLTLPERASIDPYRLGWARGKLVDGLRPKDFREKEIDNLRKVYSDDPILFELLLKEWIKQSLDYVYWFTTRATDFSLSLEQLLNVPAVCLTISRSAQERGSLSKYKYGKLFKLWMDYRVRVAPKPLVARVSRNCVDILWFQFRQDDL